MSSANEQEAIGQAVSSEAPAGTVADGTANPGGTIPHDNIKSRGGYLCTMLNIIVSLFKIPTKSIRLGNSLDYQVDQSIYDKLTTELALRYGVSLETIRFFDKEGFDFGELQEKIPLRIRLAITDVFTEKAIVRLTRRAYWYSFYGTIMVSLFLSLLIYSYNHLTLGYYSDLLYDSYFVDAPGDQNVQKYQVHVMWDGYTFGLEMSRHLAIGAIFAAGLYFTAAFAKAFIEEATKLFNRRHAVRAGRLAIWLRNGDVSSEDIARFFSVSSGDNSAMGSVDATFTAKTPAGTIADLVPKIIEAMESKKH